MNDQEKTAITVAEIKKDIQYIKKFIENADKKYASKTAEKLVYGLVGIVLIAVASALVAGVVKAAECILTKNVL